VWILDAVFAGNEIGESLFRVTIHEVEDANVIVPEGRIAGPWANELRRLWMERCTHLSSRKLLVDLRSVTWVDSNGMQILREICSHPRIEFVANTPWTRHLAEEVMGNATECHGDVQEDTNRPKIESDYRSHSDSVGSPGQNGSERISMVENDRTQEILNCIGDAVICTDIWGNITFLNRTAEWMTGWPLKNGTGRTVAEALQDADPSTRSAILELMAKAALENRAGRLPASGVFISRNREGGFAEDCVAPIRDRSGRVSGSTIVFRDMTTTRALTDRLAYVAHHDPLTALPNRALLNDRLNQAILQAERDRRQAAVLFLDVDGFKLINDSLGHEIGDKLLQSIAKRLPVCVRAPDTVCRIGGDEFVVLLKDLEHREDAAATAMRLLRAMAEVYSIDNHQIYATGCIGISLYPGDGRDADMLIRNADTAMYRAKQNGRQSYQFFGPEMDLDYAERQSIEEDLRHALERKEFTLHYQPRIDLKTGAVTGVEALSRWKHPTRGVVFPAQFIPVADRTGQIIPLGEWALKEACTQAQAWTDAGIPAKKLTVNISGVQLRSEDFLGNLFTTLSTTGLSSGLLELDIAERTLMKDNEHTKSTLKTLKDQGVQVSVDNFGTGDCSLKRLQQLPLDVLKIDPSLVCGVISNPNVTKLVNTMIGMGQWLNLKVVAGGVETIEVLEFLRTRNCDEAQGHYLGRPVPPEELGEVFGQHGFPLA
jgi:diguanylate cyclase (GGDEF)-like protein/PAS domain S-box-containing protein